MVSSRGTQNVLVIGSGGREHAIAHALVRNPDVRVFAAPGNPGIAEIGEICPQIQATDFKRIEQLVCSAEIDLTIVGPEQPLADGIVDYFFDRGLVAAGHEIFGPTQKAAKLETNKAWARNRLREWGIPQPDYRNFNNVATAREYVERRQAPLVVKAAGLAAGKGVIVCDSTEEALDAIDRIMLAREFGNAGNRIVIEEKLQGKEVSVLAITDGKNVIPFIPAQDHKPVFETEVDRDAWLSSGGDRRYQNASVGPNTGGMGAYAPAPFVTPETMKRIYRDILCRAVVGMRAMENLFTGCLYAGLMIDEQGNPKVLEFNVRFGDPETQVVLPLLKTDLFDLLNASVVGTLRSTKAEFYNAHACCVVMASGVYPGDYKKGLEIHGLDTLEDMDDVTVYHAGTVEDDAHTLRTNGGRVLGITAVRPTLRAARNAAYDGVERGPEWENAYWRRDIASKALR